MNDSTRNSKRLPTALIGILCSLAIVAGACGGGDAGGSDAGASAEAGGLSGTIKIDGSSTVAPLSEAAAELFQDDNGDVRVTVGTSGTGGGF